MNLPIIQSIMHGSLKPNLCNLKFMELESKFEKLPEDLSKLEKLFISNFPDHKFDFDDERAICLNYISSQEYTPINDDLIYNKLELPLQEPTSPKEGFYQSIVNAEILRVKLAIVDYSVMQQSDIDTIYEIKSTLTSIVKHIKYIDNDCDVIFSTLRTQLICFYVELSHMASSLLEQNKDYYPFKNLMYEIFNRYPTKEEMEIYTKFCDLKNQEIPQTPVENIIIKSSPAIQLLKTKYDTFINVVQVYDFLNLPKLKVLSPDKKKELIMNLVKSIPYAIAMIEFLEYPKYLKAKYSEMNTKEALYRHISKALEVNHDTVKGQFLAYNNPNSGKAVNYSSYMYIDEVKNDYNSIIHK